MAAATPIMSAQRKPQNDVFSMLAAAGSSSSVSTRATTPAQSSALGGNVPARPVQKANNTAPSGGGRGADAFSGLLSGSFPSGSGPHGANLTIAQRAALVEKQKQASAAQTKSPAAKVSSAWAGLDALGGGGGTSNMSSTKSSTPSHDPLDDLGFGSFTSAPANARAASKSPQPPLPADDDWLGDFTAAKPTAPPASKPKPTSTAQTLLDWDDFESGPHTRPAAAHTKPRNDTLGDFDFGGREDGLLGEQSGDEDDILGDLGKPVEQLQAALDDFAPQDIVVVETVTVLLGARPVQDVNLGSAAYRE
uniref:Alcohol oxidase n=1 Tax=Ganoderma boninense TaxID=34458 RepID=A0A5K1K4I0_9APHY|nr:Alcohol oxidase [Ganoderma boninense]